jgi:TolA-binding protein
MLAKGAMKAMFIAKVKMVAAVVAAVVVTGAAVPAGIAVAQAVSKDEGPKTNTASVVDDATAMCLRAQQQMKSGDFKAAIQTFETLLQTYPDAKTIRPEALYWLGDCYSKAEDPAAAKRVWEKLNSEFPESNWGKYGRGRLSADNGFITLNPHPDYEVPDYPTNSLPEAEAILLKRADEAFAKRLYGQAFPNYRKLSVLSPRSPAWPHVMLRIGRMQQRQGNHSMAIEAYREVLNNRPDLAAYAAPALLYLAQCHYLDKNVKEATKAIAQLRADKDYVRHEQVVPCAMFLSARMQAEGGKTDEALATLGAIGAPFPAYAALAQLRQAEVYEKAGRTAEAVAAYQATLTKYPDAPEAALAHSALEKMGSR